MQFTTHKKCAGFFSSLLCFYKCFVRYFKSVNDLYENKFCVRIDTICANNFKYWHNFYWDYLKKKVKYKMMIDKWTFFCIIFIKITCYIYKYVFVWVFNISSLKRYLKNQSHHSTLVKVFLFKVAHPLLWWI